MIRAEKIYKSFGDQEVLKDINLTFEAGKTNLIIGRSGAGKTVLLKILVGLYGPTSGIVWYDDVNFTELDKKKVRDIRMKVGMLFQGTALFDSMTVEENIRFPMDMFTNKTAKEKLDRVNYCLERVNLTGVNKKFPSQLSGGMQKRAGIARAIVLQPTYLFCDEPNSGLDPRTSILIDNLIKEITEEYDMTTIVITHDMNSVIEIGDSITFIYKGEKWWEGNKEEILVTPNKEVQNFVYASSILQAMREKTKQ